MRIRTNFTPTALLLLVVTMYAIFVTSFHTSLVFTIPLILFIQYCFSKIEFVSIKPIQFWIGLLISSGFFVGVFFFNYWGSGHDYVLLSGDLQFYSRLSEFLNVRRIETNTLDYFNGNLVENPYHYTELWLTALISRMSSLHYDVSFVLAIWGIIWGIVYYNLVVLTKLILKRETILNYILPFVFPFIGVFAFLYPDKISILTQDIWDVPLIRYGKQIVITLGILPSLILYSRKDLIGALACLMLTGIIYFPVLPAFSLFGGISFSFLFFQRKIEWFNEKFWFFLGVVFSSVIGFSIFYYLANKGGINSSIGHSSFNISTIQFEVYIKTIINIIGKTSIGVFITTMPYLLIFYYLKIKNRIRQKTLYLFLLFYLSCILIWGLFYVLTDSVQLYANAFFPVLHLLIYCGLIYLFIINFKFAGLVAISLLLFGIITKRFEYRMNVEVYCQAEISKFQQFIDKQPSAFYRSKKPIVYAYSKDWSKVKTFFGLKTVVFPPMNSLRLFGAYRPICLNVGDMPISNDLNTKNDELTIKNQAPYSKLLHSDKNIEDVLNTDIYNSSKAVLLSNLDLPGKQPSDTLIVNNERFYVY